MCGRVMPGPDEGKTDMAVRKLAPEELQPATSRSRPRTRRSRSAVIAKYPAGRQASAVIPLLWRAQEQHGGWLPRTAIEAVAARLAMPAIRVMEVATFYTMFNLDPVGKHFIQFCGTTPCVLRGADDDQGGAGAAHRRGAATSRRTGCSPGSRSSASAPAATRRWCRSTTIYYEDLTIENFETLLDDLAAGRPVKAGSQIGRRSSEPLRGRQDPDRSRPLRRLADRRLAQALRGGGAEARRHRRGRGAGCEPAAGRARPQSRRRAGRPRRTPPTRRRSASRKARRR